MQWLLFYLGVWWDRLLGDRRTEETFEEVAYPAVTYRTDSNDQEIKLGLEIRQRTYRTRFTRWWIPDKLFVLFEVKAFASEAEAPYIDPRFFERITYPMLCNPLLRHTRFPQAYVMRAFLDRVPGVHLTNQREL